MINNEVMTYLVKCADALETWISQQQIELDEVTGIKNQQKELEKKIEEIEDLEISIKKNITSQSVVIQGIETKVNVIFYCVVSLFTILIGMVVAKLLAG